MVHRAGEGRLKQKQYEQAYFDRWYRAARTGTRVELERRVQLVLALTEHLLERPVRSVLDVGCGEGRWYPLLRRLRPRARYVGVDPSRYAVERYGRARNLLLGRVDALDETPVRGMFDLIVCADVLHYLSDREVASGVRQIGRRLRGVAYLQVFSSEDPFDGDRRGWRGRSPRWYQRVFRDEGLLSCGMHCYALGSLHESLASLERVT